MLHDHNILKSHAQRMHKLLMLFRKVADLVSSKMTVWQYVKLRKKFSECRKEMDDAQKIGDMLRRYGCNQLPDVGMYRKLLLQRILTYSGKHCPYYRNLFRNVGFMPSRQEGFSRIPLLDKKIIRHHYNEIFSDEVSKLSTYRMNTGGSTGEPLEFVVSTLAGRIDYLHQEHVFRSTMGFMPGDIIAAFDGSTVPMSLRERGIYWIDTGTDIPYGRRSYSSLYLCQETLPVYVRSIVSLKPAILRGYPSFLNEIAQYILSTGIELQFPIKGIQLTAENVHDWQIANIRKAFMTDVYLQYGHSEVCVYGFTRDETFQYICSPFYGYVEILGEDATHVPVGQVGEIVVTGFHNFAMPFIRYKTGDMAIYGGECGGAVSLRKIIGRSQDYIYGKHWEKIALTAVVFGQHFQAFKNIRKWQIQQDVVGRIIVRVVKDAGYSESDSVEIKEKFKRVSNVDVEIHFVEAIPRTDRGKFLFLIQNLEGL